MLPFTELEAWSAGLEAPGCENGDDLAQALARDRERLRQRLGELVERSDFREALFIASPALEAALERWSREPETARGQSTEEAVVAYFSRAAARPTPFGLFAGSTTGTIDRQTSLRLGPRTSYGRHTRLDTEYLSRLADTIAADAVLRRQLEHRPNSSLYEVGGRLHFAERHQGANGRSYTLVAVDQTPYLAATLERAAYGARLDDLAAALVDDEVTEADARGYLDELVDSQVLAPDVGPQLTGPHAADGLIDTLARHEETAPIAERLADARARLAEIDARGVGASPDRYRSVGASLDDVPVEQGDLSRLVQVDLTKPATDVRLGTGVVKEVTRAVRALHAFSPLPASDPLTRFRDAFSERYETREVPLVEALDEEHGIGFDRPPGLGDDTPPLLAGLPLAPSRDESARWTFREALLLSKLAHALAAGAGEIALGDDDVTALEAADRPPPPRAFEVVASLEAASAAAVDAGDFRVFVHSASGPPGARLLARFCYADDVLRESVAAHLRVEEAADPDALFAEIVHLPEGRVGNIISRPVLRDHEIPYLGVSGAPLDRQIPASDLLVSVENDVIVLRSRRLRKQVVPRMTTAHNYGNRSLRVYRFLCALQGQGVLSALTWQWGALEAAPFLPRVTHGRAVLFRARWRLDNDELAAFREPRGRARFEAVRRLRTARGLPRWVALADADNELAIDLDNVMSVDALARQVRTRGGAAVVELFPAPDHLCVEAPEGRFINQLVVPFVRDDAPSEKVRARPRSGIARRFAPGSEWLYLKVFCGTATADVALDRVAYAVEAAFSSGAADRWFFIRYSDPHWHLRVRIHGNGQRLLADTLPATRDVLAPLLASERVWRVQLDTYEREVERYGGDAAISVAEEVFHADSDAAVATVRALAAGDPDLRWRAALLGLHLLFDDFRLTLDERRHLVRRACAGYGSEFGAGRAFQERISRRFREERNALESLIGDRGEGVAALAPVLEALRARSERLQRTVGDLRGLADAGKLTHTVPDIVFSYAHMHANRVLRSAQRAQELVLYELLGRVYSSQVARR